MTRTRRALLWTALLGFALALRIGLALRSPNIFFPDEVFQTLEPAHRLAFGYGVISWEWRLGIRSWVFPAFLAGVMRATAWMGSGSAGYLLGTAIVLSLVSLVAVWFGYAWAKRASGTPAAVIAALACSFYFGLVYFAPKALTEVVAAHAMLPGLYFGVYGQEIGERKRLFLAGLFCGLAACMRIQLLPALAFAMVYFCYPRWRARIPAAAAGVLAPALLFGAVDWLTWSYPWQSFFRYFEANIVRGPGKDLAWAQPWYWYLLALVVLIGPAVLLLVHGARRSPFLAVFCAIVILSHSAIRHKEIRFIYPVLAPAIALAAMGIVDVLKELKAKSLESSKWVAAIGTMCLLVSSAVLTVACADWCKTRWGVGAFDNLSRHAAVCGVGIYETIWWQSGGYTHLHRDVPIVPVGDAAGLKQESARFNALIAPRNAMEIPGSFSQSGCWKGVCLFERPGVCVNPQGDEALNAYLRRTGQ